ncbi:hypothetical protein GCM10010399_88320 [Dactylosporangium fulvum]|uniref:Uncharacterized protein n=1 Tax=Dactylosporangium fulvum TaxID=53359 RepID=A0ABY5W7U9_9ACTN|nr:hypothetical protein [Dactylosporangium fulvum]UWP85430.1 hypothetical protein Dfulv_14800 [Dactylosporangium fulvum]
MAEFGATPWGRAWLKTIETSKVAVPNPLLPKARSIARNDGVTSFTIQAGQIHATVALRGVTHTVHIRLPPWDSQTRPRVARLAGNARAEHPGLAPGDLPDTLEADLRREGIGIDLRGDASEHTTAPHPDSISLSDTDAAGFYGTDPDPLT